ncbi:MAG TPA: ABC transporter permease [Pseudonocardia sp.]|jgi:putative ABC transport system permease protein|nr:ABC transporter permease [Pseudonocardia sp.]
MHAAWKITGPWLRINKSRAIVIALVIAICGSAMTILTGLTLGIDGQYQRNTLRQDYHFIRILRTSPKGPGGKLYNSEPFWNQDLTALDQDHNPSDISEFVPVVTGGTAWVRHGDRTYSTGVTGSTPSYLEYAGDNMLAGNNFSWERYHDGSRVVLLSSDVAQALFDTVDNAVGANVMIGRVSYRVIGVEDDNNNAVMPLNSARDDLFGGIEALTSIGVRLAGASTAPAAVADINQIMSARREIGDLQQADFKVDEGNFIWSRWAPVVESLYWLAAAISAALLIVGILGFLVAMLGATEPEAERSYPQEPDEKRSSKILLEHLARYSLISGIGGVMGATLGCGVIATSHWFLPMFHITPSIEPVLSVMSVGLGLLTGPLIGLLGGLCPALRAVRLGRQQMQLPQELPLHHSASSTTLHTFDAPTAASVT